MKVLHQVITEKAYKQAEQRSVMNHRTNVPSFLYYGKGRKDKVVYIAKGTELNSKCSFYPEEVVPFDLDLRDDLRYFKNSHKTFVDNIAKGNNHSVQTCVVDNSGNIIKTLTESEVLEICNQE